MKLVGKRKRRKVSKRESERRAFNKTVAAVRSYWLRTDPTIHEWKHPYRRSA